ncbi:MAG: hypothetical protein U1E76_05865 [Planctomycetota bacterium]
MRSIMLGLLLGLAPAVLAPTANAQGYSGSYLDKLVQAADWFASVQDLNPFDADYGAVRTDEGVSSFYQSDQGKAIWVWSTVKKLTGSTAYDAGLALCWAYTDAIDPTTRTAYYQNTYDSLWFLFGDLAYRVATGDQSFVTRAEQHFDWILQNQLTWTIGRNLSTDGFACAAMYRWAVNRNDAPRLSAALSRADDVRANYEANPAVLADQSIEIHGSAGYWGVLESWFAEHYQDRKDWVELLAPSLPSGITIDGGYRYTYQAYLAGAYAANWEYTAASPHKGTQLALVNEMQAEDDDQDGGIPRNKLKPSTEDNSWATGLLAFQSFDLLRPDCDLAIGPENYTVTVPGNLVFDFGAANNTTSTKTFFLVAFLKFPSGSLVYLTTVPITLPGGFAFTFNDFGFPFGPGSPVGDYELKVQSYNSAAKLLDEVKLKFKVQ